MATFSPRVDGNLTDATIFGRCCHAVLPLAASNSASNITQNVNGTSVTAGTSFTLASPTEIDAIGFLMWGRGTGTGLLYALIQSGGSAVAGTRTNIAVASLPTMVYTQAGYGWVVLKLPTPVTLAAGTYNAAFYGTESTLQGITNAGNYCHFVRTTEQIAPGGNDSVIIGGEYETMDVTGETLQSSEDFSGTLANWTAVGGGTQSQSIVSGELLHVVTSGTGDPTKYMFSGGYTGTDMMVKAKIKVNSIGAASNARIGINLRGTLSGYGGYALLFRGDQPNQVRFLNEGVSFSSAYAFTWTTGTYYYFKLAVVGARCYGKVWAASGSEPDYWMFSYTTNGSRTSGYAGVIASTTNQTSNFNVDDFEVYSITGVTANGTRELIANTTSGSPVTFQYFAVNRGGTVKHPTNADSQLRFASNGGSSGGLLYPMAIHSGGRYEIGSTANPIPAAYTAIFECVGHTNTDFAIAVWEGSEFLAHGTDTRTRRTTLTANQAAAASSITHGTVSGWTAGDIIGISGTSRNNFPGVGTVQNEMRTIGTPGTTSTVVTAAFTYAHDGGFSPTGSGHTFGAMVVNLTRNVKIRGTSVTSTISIYYAEAGTLDVRHAEHRYWGGNTDPRRGYYIQGNTINTFRVEGCSFYDFRTGGGVGFYHRGTTGYVSLIDNVGYGCASGDHWYYGGLTIPAQNDVIITGNVCINFAGNIYRLIDANVICSDNWAGGCNAGFEIYSSNTPREFENNWTYNTNYHILTTNPSGLLCIGGRAWRTREIALWHEGTGHITGTPNLNGRFAHEHVDFIAAGCGNVGATATIYQRENGYIIVRDSKIYGDPSASVNYAWANGGAASGGVCEIINTVLGTTGYTFGSVAALRGQGAQWLHIDDCPLGISSSPVVNQSYASYPSQCGVGFTNYNGTNGDNRTYKGTGTLQTDTTIYRTAAPSLRMTPAIVSGNTMRLTTEGLIGGFLVQCPAGEFRTINVYIRRSVLGDGAAYNGDAPRLIMNPNYAGGGVSTQQVLATSVSAAGSWELLTGVTPSALIDTTFEFYIDCNGTAGWVNVDDITIT